MNRQINNDNLDETPKNKIKYISKFNKLKNGEFSKTFLVETSNSDSSSENCKSNNKFPILEEAFRKSKFNRESEKKTEFLFNDKDRRISIEQNMNALTMPSEDKKLKILNTFNRFFVKSPSKINKGRSLSPKERKEIHNSENTRNNNELANKYKAIRNKDIELEIEIKKVYSHIIDDNENNEYNKKELENKIVFSLKLIELLGKS